MLHIPVDMDTSFSNAELAQILDRPSRFIIDWSERELIEADVTPATGPGSRRRYSYQATLRAALGVHLKERYGMSRHIIKNILDQLSGWTPDFFADWSHSFALSRKERHEAISQDYKEAIRENKGTEADKAILEEGLRRHREKSIHSKTGCLTIIFYKDGSYKFLGTDETLESRLLSLHYEVIRAKKADIIISDMVTINLEPIKGEVDQRIKALP